MSQSAVSVTEVDPTEVRPPTTLFSQAQLEVHAAALATAHRVAADRRRGRPLLPRLEECAAKLEDAYQLLSTVERADPQAVGSEEWIRDNYHIVLDQIREVRQDLPKAFYFELPKLADGPGAGYPRVYYVASELVAHTAGRLEVETLVDFVVAYQRAIPLSIGETWAIPIMLRVSLVEELSRLVDGVIAARQSREKARRWEVTIAEEQGDLQAEFDRLVRAEKEASGRLPAAFVVELLQWLRDQPPSASPAWLALHRALDTQGDTPEELLRSEHQREATDQLAIGNVIGSMRLLSSVDWPLFFDRVSVVEQILRGDPVRAYARMDFQTRDRYRHSVEELAKRSREPEIGVAKRAIALAVAAQQRDPQNDRSHHVGYFLVSRGRFVSSASCATRRGCASGSRGSSSPIRRWATSVSFR